MSRLREQAKNANAKNARERGFVLLIVLVVVTMLSFAAYTFSEMMITSYEGSLQGGDQLQAQMLVESGVDYTRQFFAQLPSARVDAGGVYNNPALFQNIIVVGDATTPHQGSFTVVSPSLDATGQLAGVRYGFEDESARLNMNILLWADGLQEGAGRNLLMALPGMTEDVADAILDWMDEDDEPREFGAEIETYSALDPPYQPKNGPLDTVEELLLVRGVTPQLLFGVDINRNGNVDSHEMTGLEASTLNSQSLLAGVPSSDGGGTSSLARGWSAYITLFSAESNLNAAGEPRIDLNGDDLETLYEELETRLGELWATFIVAYRQNGEYTGNEDGEAVQGGLDLTQEGGNKISQLLDLVGKKTTARIDGQEVVIAPIFPSEVVAMATYMPTLMDNCSISSSETIPGRININQAPRAVLLGIPTMTAEIADEIIAQRDVTGVDADESRRHETWLMTEAIVTLDEMRLLTPFICGAGAVYRGQIVGYFQDGGVSARVEVVIDASSESPSVLEWKDISHLGRGYPLNVLGVSYAAAAE